MQEESFHSDQEQGDGTPLCPNCLAPMSPTTQLCDQCGAPVGTFAMTDPYTAIFSTGWMYRKAISSGTSTISYIVIWLIFGPTTIFATIALIYTSIELPDYDLAQFTTWFVAFVLNLVQIRVLYIATKSYIKFLKIKEGHCESCNYNLHGLTESRCPECGTPYDPDDLLRDELVEERPEL